MSSGLVFDDVTWSYVVFFVACFACIAYSIIAVAFTASLSYSSFYLHKTQETHLNYSDLPPVSIVKPLMGIDSCLEENLLTYFTLKYPKFELLICVQDHDDPVINLVHKLQEQHPQVDCRLFIGGQSGIINPLVCNVAPGYEAASYDLVWVSTSRIHGSADILMDMVARIAPSDVALVHQLPFTCDQKGFPAALEKVHFGTQISRYYLASHVLSISCFTGMSYLIKKHELDKLQGMAWFGRFIAEDYFIAKFLREKGFRHQVAAIPAQQNASLTSIAVFKDRMVRWLRLRLNLVPFTAAILEPLSESVVIGVYMAWATHHLFAWNPVVFFAGHWTVWCLLDYIQLTNVQNGALPFSIPVYVLAWILRELLVVYIYFEALIGVRYIKWGKRTYHISNFGRSMHVVPNKHVCKL